VPEANSPEGAGDTQPSRCRATGQRRTTPPGIRCRDQGAKRHENGLAATVVTMHRRSLHVVSLTLIRDRPGPSRLLDMVEGRSKQVFKTWLAGRPQAGHDQLEVVAMDGFTQFKTAAAESLPTPSPRWTRSMSSGTPADAERLDRSTNRRRRRTVDPLSERGTRCPVEARTSDSARVQDVG